MLDTLDAYQEIRKNENVILAYKGDFSDDLFNSIMMLAESKLDKVEFQSKLKKKVFNIVVELLQNVYHYFMEVKGHGGRFFTLVFFLIKEEEGYTIIAGNHILKERIQDLQARIDEINKLTPEQLREVYRERLDKGNLSDTGRAGLGILDIVRKSGQQLDYNFRSIDEEELSFFSLQIKISA